MSQYSLRLPAHVMVQAEEAAVEDEVSVDQILVGLIVEGLDHRKDLRAMLERAARADVGAALALLETVPDVPADAGDELRTLPSSAKPANEDLADEDLAGEDLADEDRVTRPTSAR